LKLISKQNLNALLQEQVHDIKIEKKKVRESLVTYGFGERPNNTCQELAILDYK